jgi:N,N'-diacetyllegionaminate synthase
MAPAVHTPITIGPRTIGRGHPLFFIAEIGVNHNGDMGLAKRLIDAAVDAGADAAKFQTFSAERLNTRRAPKADYHIQTTGPDSEQSWFDLLRSQELTPTMHRELMDYCRRRGIVFLSTPYDEQSADLLEDCGVPAFKIASTDANNIPLLRHVARKGRPMILSTGMCTMAEVKESVGAIRKEGLEQVILMHCTAAYPAPLDQSHLRAMVTLQEELDVLVGYSDHTLEDVNPVLAVALGAVVYEKHITEDRALPGPDHRVSLTPDELKRTVRSIRLAETALGMAEKAVQPAEREHRAILRKSVVAACDIKAGEALCRENLTVKRPGTGIPPGELESLLGRRLRVNIQGDTILRMQDLDDPSAE